MTNDNKSIDLFKKKAIKPAWKNASDFESAISGVVKTHMDSGLYFFEFLGVKIRKHPCDLITIQEMITKLRPDNIIETGGGYGGSAVFYTMIADYLDLPGHVYSIELLPYDLDPMERLVKKFNGRLKYLQKAMSVGFSVIDDILIPETKGKNNLVLLDSYHGGEYVFMEMEMYSQFVQPGGYMIVEDTCLSGNPVWGKYPKTMNGPMEAVDRFIGMYDNWVIDRSCEKHLTTYNPRGFLRRIG